MNLTAKQDKPAAAALWPKLDNIGLKGKQVTDRNAGIGGSDANVILGGDAQRVLRLWREKRGEAEGESLFSVLPVMLGNWTEAFNRQWYERQTGFEVGEVGLIAISASHPWRRATLDGIVETRASVWEAKHVGAFAKPEEILARYMPQLQHNMAVMELENATLSVIYGNHKWECYEVAADWLFQDALLHAEREFWNSVLTGVAPDVAEPLKAPRPDAFREISFEGNNSWAAAADDWLQNAEAAKRHANSVIAIKELVEPDVARAFGHGIEARRSKVGAITIRRNAR